jgi:nitrite reductase/ring-hydroxylating ferredoxin subunit
MTTTAPGAALASAAPAGHMLGPLGPGYHQCWYPVEVSAKLGQGEVIGADLGDGRIVVYRGEDGSVHALSAYCKHMGSDLSVGDVIGNDIRCAFHHWSYGPDGRCNDIPSGDRIPRAACVARLPIEEKWGLIWVFFGREPLYPVPSFADWDDDRMVYRAFEAPFDQKLLVDPWVFTTNIFDIVHNRVVHGLRIADPDIDPLDDYTTRMEWRATYEEREQGDLRTEILVFGTNAIRAQGEHDGRLAGNLAALSPMGRAGTRAFFCVMAERSDDAEEFLDRQQATHTRFVNEDLPILNTMRMGKDHLVAADRAMVRYIRYARSYPRTTMAELEG